jgi:hypothetical protein
MRSLLWVSFLFCHGQNQVGWDVSAEIRMELAEVDAGQLDQLPPPLCDHDRSALAPEGQL